MEIDFEALILLLPEKKQATLRNLLTTWNNHQWCFKSELQSLTDKLQHTWKVVHPEWTFLCCVFELLKGVHHAHHHIRLKRAIHSDLVQLESFPESWNGTSSLHPLGVAVPDHEVY